MEINLSASNYLVMVAYMVAVVVVGAWFSRKENTSEDFLLGGRSIPWMAVGISFMMSLLSTYSLVMVPGEIFNNGVSLFALGLLGPLFTLGGFFLFMRFYFRLGSFTPFEYIERRYDSRVRFMIAMIFLWSRLVYLGMVLFTTSIVFEGAAGWPAWVTILVVGVIGIIYTVMGGMKAVIWTDVLQFGVLALGLGLAVVICCGKVKGGALGIISYAFEHGRGPSLYLQKSFYSISPYMRLCFWLLLLGSIQEAIFTTSADQITIQRLLSTSNYRSALKATITASVIQLPAMLILWFIGFAVFSFYSQNPDPRVASGDKAFFTFVSTQLPSPLPGLILAGMLAAAMSTLDSGMNSLSAVWVKEFYVKYLRKTASEKKQVSVSRQSTVYIGLFAIAIGIIIAVSANTIGQTVVEAATVFWSLCVVILPAFLFAVFSKRASSRMIWTLAMICWGMNFALSTWYLCTKSPDSPYLHTMSCWIFYVPLSAAIVLAITGLIIRSRTRFAGKAVSFLSLLVFGYSAGTGIWYLTSNFFADSSTGYSLSFQWTGFPGLVTFILAGTLWTLFSPAPAKHKYQGLTLATMNQKMIALKDGE